MSLWGNALGYQAVWLLAVYGAGAGCAGPALLAASAYAAWQLGVSRERRTDLRLAGAALGCGLVLDGILARCDLLRYAVASPALPPGGAPLWILSLWLAFSLTLNHSLRFLKARPLVAALCGAAGGPLAYAAAARLAHAVSFRPPPWRAWAVLALGWSAAMVLLGTLAAAGTAASPRKFAHGERPS